MPSGRSWADDLPDMPAEQEDEELSALASIPGWFWGMLGGVVGITGFSMTVRIMLPDDDSPRGIIALTQLAVGLISMITAHGLAARFAMKHDRRLNLTDIMLSWFNIWQPTIAELPGTCRRVLAMAWGGFAVLTAVTLIGGIDYSAPFRVHNAPKVKPMKLIGAVAAAARAQAGKDAESIGEAIGDLQSEVAAMEEATGQQGGPPKAMEDALAELGNMDDQLNQFKDAGSGPDSDEKNEDEAGTLQCFIYGVETDDRNVPTAFLFAASRKGSDRHVAVIKTSDLPEEDFRTIAVRLYPAVRREPVIETKRQAVWVEPIVSCRLAHKGSAENGELKEPKFEAILVQQKGRMDWSETVQ